MGLFFTNLFWLTWYNITNPSWLFWVTYRSPACWLNCHFRAPYLYLISSYIIIFIPCPLSQFWCFMHLAIMTIFSFFMFILVLQTIDNFITGFVFARLYLKHQCNTIGLKICKNLYLLLHQLLFVLFCTN